MKKKSYEGMTVRIPINVAKEVRKLREDKDLGSYGLALTYWIEQQKDEEIQLQLADIKVKLEEIVKFNVGIEDNIRMLSMILFRLSEGFYKPKALKEFLEEQKSKYAPILKALESYVEEKPKKKHLT